MLDQFCNVWTLGGTALQGKSSSVIFHTCIPRGCHLKQPESVLHVGSLLLMRRSIVSLALCNKTDTSESLCICLFLPWDQRDSRKTLSGLFWHGFALLCFQCSFPSGPSGPLPGPVKRHRGGGSAPAPSSRTRRPRQQAGRTSPQSLSSFYP